MSEGSNLGTPNAIVYDGQYREVVGPWHVLDVCSRPLGTLLFMCIDCNNITITCVPAAYQHISGCVPALLYI